MVNSLRPWEVPVLKGQAVGVESGVEYRCGSILVVQYFGAVTSQLYLQYLVSACGGWLTRDVVNHHVRLKGLRVGPLCYTFVWLTVTLPGGPPAGEQVALRAAAFERQAA